MRMRFEEVTRLFEVSGRAGRVILYLSHYYYSLARLLSYSLQCIFPGMCQPSAFAPRKAGHRRRHPLPPTIRFYCHPQPHNGRNRTPLRRKLMDALPKWKSTERSQNGDGAALFISWHRWRQELASAGTPWRSRGKVSDRFIVLWFLQNFLPSNRKSPSITGFVQRCSVSFKQ